MPIRTYLTAAGLGLSLLLAGCAGGGGPDMSGDPFSASSDGPQTITIRVRNLNFSEARLWAISRSGRERLGVIGGKADGVYRIGWNFSQPLQVEIDLLAGPRCTTEPLEVDPGDEIDLQIELDLSRMMGCR